MEKKKKDRCIINRSPPSSGKNLKGKKDVSRLCPPETKTTGEQKKRIGQRKNRRGRKKGGGLENYLKIVDENDPIHSRKLWRLYRKEAAPLYPSQKERKIKSEERAGAEGIESFESSTQV